MSAQVVDTKGTVKQVPRENLFNRFKGLSRLQKKILVAALLKPNIQRHELLSEFWGWKRVGTDYGLKLRPGDFDPQTIGKDRYNRANTTLSRSIGRLIARGLAEWVWMNKERVWFYGLQLTPAGSESAAELVRQGYQ